MTLHPDAPPLPVPVRELAQVLATLPGATAVALAGSRAAGDADGGSDWDLTVYYRGAARAVRLDLTRFAGRVPVERLGETEFLPHTGFRRRLTLSSSGGRRRLERRSPHAP